MGDGTGVISRIKTIITTDIDIETFDPSHSTSIEAEDELPEEVVAAAVYGGCKATMRSLEARYPRFLKDDQAPQPPTETGV
jgi:hypothetical protein